MSKELGELAAVERKLYEAIPLPDEEEDAQSDRVYQEYEKVASQYCALADRGDVEALKRVTFLWWLAALEPSHLSGLHRFDSGRSMQVAAALIRRSSDGFDEEFQRMLEWYYSITPWHFEEFTPTLVHWLKTLIPMGSNGSTDLSVLDLEAERGQMSSYFRQMRAAQG